MTLNKVCNLCKSDISELYGKIDSTTVFCCRNCGLIFVGEMQKIGDLKKLYSKEYFEPYFKAEKVHLEKRFKKRLDELKHYVPKGTLLDVGCGAGFFLRLASVNGYAAKGVEFSKFAVEYARHNFSLDVFLGDLNDANFEPESFDVITLWHIIEHVQDPKQFITKVNRLLKKEGLLALEVPNIGSPAAVISGMSWELIAPREHFYYFNPSTMKRLLQDTGFTILKSQTYYWTTPSMYFKAKADTAHKFIKVLMNLCALALLPLSFILRFRIAPRSFPGDVIIVYARKTAE